MWKPIALVSAAALLCAVALAWWVVESSGVAVIETQRPDGGVRRTRVWFVRTGDGFWLEAGRPEHPWYRDVQRDSRVVLHVDGEAAPLVAAIVPGRSAHDLVRGLLREKYGLRDRMLGWVVDTSRSVAVRLEPVPGAADRPRRTSDRA